jgi:HrpA-like RNA helicase
LYGVLMMCNGRRVLYEAGGLTRCDEEAEVTELGRVGVHMPVDLPLVKLILLGRAFGCVNDAIVMAAALSLQVTRAICFTASAIFDASCFYT